MYLKNLNKEEKENFLELAYYIANCDEHFDPEESNMLKKFRDETDLNENTYTIKKLSLDNIIKGFENSTDKNKITVFLEIIGVVLADLKFNGNEQKAISMLRRVWNIDDEKYTAVLRWYESMDKKWQIV